MNFLARLAFVSMALIPMSAVADASRPVFDDWFVITKDKDFRKPAGFAHATGSWVEKNGQRLYKLQKTQEVDTSLFFIRLEITSDEVAYYDEEGLLSARVDFTRGDKVMEVVGKRRGDLFEVTQTTTEDGESEVVRFSKSLSEVKRTSFDVIKPIDIDQWPVSYSATEPTFVFLKEELYQYEYESLGRRFENLRGETIEVIVLEVEGAQDSEVWYDKQGRRLAGKQRIGSFYRVDQQTAEDWRNAD